MISESRILHHAGEAYVWIWLPEQTNPVVAGRIVEQGRLYRFTYGRSYRERDDAIALSPFELPLQAGTFEPQGLNVIHSCLRDGAPDAWGRRVIAYQYPGFDAGELDYLLLSGSDRIGALDFQLSASEYLPRQLPQAGIDELLQAADLVDRRQPLPAELGYALLHATSVGGARPKALIRDASRHISYIAKFSSSTDSYEIVKAEYMAMRLAQLAGLQTAAVQLQSSMGKDVLLVERFDRIYRDGKQARRLMLSGLSLLGLNEMEARYASYRELADIVRRHFADPKAALAELYGRLIFNVLIGNTDDHARNHAAFWDGKQLELTPAYDICPQPRVGQEATQAMAIDGEQGNRSNLVNVLSVCAAFRLEQEEAKDMINTMIAVIEDHWTSVCDEAGLVAGERARLWRQAVLNPYCFYGW